jgi:hypothetical protein
MQEVGGLLNTDQFLGIVAANASACARAGVASDHSLFTHVRYSPSRQLLV